MFREDGGRPNDTRGFLHKSIVGRVIGGAVKGLVTGGPGGAIRGAALGLVRQPTRKTVSRSTTARPSITGEQEKELGRTLKFEPMALSTTRAPMTRIEPRTIAPPRRMGGGGGRTAGNGDCPSGTIPDPEGRDFCVSPRSPFGRGRGAERAPVGDAVMGQFGAALEPGVQIIERSVCLPGMQLAKDGLCYNKGAITNSQRMWPRGRRPLLTGGDMRAIGIASRAGSKLDRTTKRLRALGMMKKLPTPRKAPPHAHAKPVAAVSV